MDYDRQAIKKPTSSSGASKTHSRCTTNSTAISSGNESSADQTLPPSPKRKSSASRSAAGRATPSSPRKIALSLSPITAMTSSRVTRCLQTPIPVSPQDLGLPLSPLSIRYETTTPSTPPLHSNTPAILSPTRLPLSLSPPPTKTRSTSPPITSLTQLPPPLSPPPIKKRSTTPPSTSPLPSHPCYTPLTPPPQRPPRPFFSLPNLRPTIILSPILASKLPPEDRPPAFHLPSPKAHYKRTHTHSPHSSSSSSEYITALPSPVFFAPRSWSSQGQYSPLKFSTSPTRSEKEKHCELHAFRYDWANDSITALPPPRPPPTCPLPLPPSHRRLDEPAYSDEKIVVNKEEITVYVEREPRRLTYYQRHKRTIKMIITLILIVVLAAGIAGGIIWKLQSMCKVKCR